jgi:hypothetical protein
MFMQAKNIYRGGNPSLSAIREQVPLLFVFRFLRTQTKDHLNKYIIYIEWQRDYAGQDESGIRTHRNALGTDRMHICISDLVSDRDSINYRGSS